MSDTILDLPSTDYMSSQILSSIPNDAEPTRDQLIGAAIERCIDMIYLSMYAKRVPFTKKSTCHIRRLIVVGRSWTTTVTRQCQASEMEIKLIQRLLDFQAQVLDQDRVSYELSGIDGLMESFINRVPEDNSQLLRYFRTVLAIAGQFTYQSGSLTIPEIQVSPNSRGYAKSLSQLDPSAVFDLARVNEPHDTTRLWYRLFQGVRVSPVAADSVEQIKQLLSKVYIDIVPDIANGIGVSSFTLDAAFSCRYRRKFIDESGGVILDGGIISSMLHSSNTTVELSSVDHIMQGPVMDSTDGSTESYSSWFNSTVAALEEAEDKAEEGGDEEEEEDEGGDEPAKDDASGDEGGDEPAKDEASGDEPDEGGDEPAEDDASGDEGGDEPAEDDASDEEGDDSDEESDDQDTPSEDGEDKEADSKPMILGLGLKLAKGETLDDYLYKVTVANYISDLIKFNHDGLPQDTVNLLKNWKDGFLFLAAAEETEALLSELNINVLGE